MPRRHQHSGGLQHSTHIDACVNEWLQQKVANPGQSVNHNPVTLGAGSNPALTLSGQQLTLSSNNNSLFTAQTTDANWTNMTPTPTALAQNTAVTWFWQVIGFHPGNNGDHHSVIGRSSAYWIPPAVPFVETVLVDGIGLYMPANFNIQLAVDAAGQMTFQVKGTAGVTVNWSLVATVCKATSP